MKTPLDGSQVNPIARSSQRTVRGSGSIFSTNHEPHSHPLPFVSWMRSRVLRFRKALRELCEVLPYPLSDVGYCN